MISFASFSPFSNLHFIIVTIANTVVFCVCACLRKKKSNQIKLKGLKSAAAKIAVASS